jgi:hypothetical protein
MEPKIIIFSYVLPIVILLLGIYISITTSILKDDSTTDNKPYSFSKVQLMWWSLLIIPLFSCYFGWGGDPGKIDPSILILLGISVGTTTAAKIIDTTDTNSGVTRHQNTNTTNSFWYNILSDKDGVSVHRFQAVAFNIIYGFIFIYAFFTSDPMNFYGFKEFELALLGISSAGYLGVKLNENK